MMELQLYHEQSEAQQLEAMRQAIKESARRWCASVTLEDLRAAKRAVEIHRRPYCLSANVSIWVDGTEQPGINRL